MKPLRILGRWTRVQQTLIFLVLFLMRTLQKPTTGIEVVKTQFETHFTKHQHRQRVAEYERFYTDFNTVLATITRRADPTAYLSAPMLSKLTKEVQTCLSGASKAVPAEWDASSLLAQACYIICRWLQPSVVVETGVARGITSAFILQALEDNNKGHLFSIDLPAIRWKSRSMTGIAVPERLHPRWTLILDASRYALPKISGQVENLGLFLHDSAHTYRTQKLEFRWALEHLCSGGILIADDADNNDALLELAEAYPFKIVAVVPQLPKKRGFGILVNP